MMSKQYIRIVLGGVFLLSLLCFSSCKHGEGEYHNIIDKIEAESVDYHGVSVSSEDFLKDLNTVEVVEGEHTFLIPERIGEIRSFACTECHTKPLSDMSSEEQKKAHWDINLVHAASGTMNCATCHNGNDMDNLKSLTGLSVNFNLSHQLCSQCHAPQFEDWKGGAHGKSVSGWAPPRVSMTCVNCHNPHKPGFDARWPARFNLQKEKERE